MDLETARSHPPGTDFYIRVRTLDVVDKEGFVSCAIDSNIGLLPRQYSYRTFECLAPPKPEPLKAGDAIVNSTTTSSGQVGTLVAIYGANAVVKFGDEQPGWVRLADYRRASILDFLESSRTKRTA